MFADGEDGAVIGTGTTPLKEKIEANRLITTLVLHDGVINHASARRLDNAGYGTETAAKEVSGAQVQHRLKDEKLEMVAALYEATQGSVGVGMHTRPDEYKDARQSTRTTAPREVSASVYLCRNDAIPGSSLGRTVKFTHGYCNRCRGQHRKKYPGIHLCHRPNA